MAGLGDSCNGDAHRLRLSGNAQTDGKLVKLRPGVMPVIAVDVGAGLLSVMGTASSLVIKLEVIPST